MTPSWSYASLWACDPRNVAEARDFVARHLLDHDLAGMVEDTVLVVSELATNAVVHARTPFEVTLSGDGRTVEVAVTDGLWTAPPLRQNHHVELGGRGLSLVEGYSRAWGVRPSSDGGKSVWASLSL